MVATHLKAWSIPALVVAVTSVGALAHALTAPVGVAPPAKQSSTAPATAPIHVRFSAPADCAGEHDFLSRVLSRVPRDEQGATPTASVHVDIVRVGPDLAGEARVTRAGSTASTSVVAVGTCDSIIEQLAQLTAQTLAARVESRAVRSGVLPANPYRDWRGPVGESLPRNPYPQLLNDIGPGVASEEAQPATERIAARNPYRW